MSVLVLDASVLVAATVDDGPEGRWAEELFAADQLTGRRLPIGR
jgi:hypothetical protein